LKNEAHSIKSGADAGDEITRRDILDFVGEADSVLICKRVKKLSILSIVGAKNCI